MTTNRFKLIIGAGLAACAFGAVPATASASTGVADAGPCTPIVRICPIEEAIELLQRIDREYEEFQEFYRAVEDDLNAYLCDQTGNPTYCNH